MTKKPLYYLLRITAAQEAIKVHQRSGLIQCYVTHDNGCTMANNVQPCICDPSIRISTQNNEFTVGPNGELDPVRSNKKSTRKGFGQL